LRQKRRYYTEEELVFLHKNAKTMPTKEIAAHLGRSVKSLRFVAAYHGISLSKIGEKHHSVKHPDSLVREACRLHYDEGVGLQELSKRLNVNYNTLAGWTTGVNRASALMEEW
jgi:hypothetical protein